MTDNLQALYNGLKDTYDLGTFDDFKRNMDDETVRKNLYDMVSSKYDVEDNYDSFSRSLGYNTGNAVESAMQANQGMVGSAAPEPEPTPAPAPESTMKADDSYLTEEDRQNIADTSKMSYREAKKLGQKAYSIAGQRPTADSSQAASQFIDTNREAVSQMEETEKLNAQRKIEAAQPIAEAYDKVAQGMRDNAKAMREADKQLENEYYTLTQAARDYATEKYGPMPKKLSSEEGWGKAYEEYLRNNDPNDIIGRYENQGERSRRRNYIAFTENMAKQTERRAKQTMREAERGFVGNTVGGAGYGISQPSSWSMGMSDMWEAGALLGLANKVKSGEPLTDYEQAALDAYGTYAEAASLLREYDTRGFKAGQTTGEMVPFMAQMAFNPAGGLGRSLERQGIRKSMEEIGAQATKDLLRSYGYDGMMARIPIALRRVGGDLAASAVLANTLQAGSTFNDVVQRKYGAPVQGKDGKYTFDPEREKSWAEAAYKAEMSGIIENFTEMMGEWKVLGVVDKLEKFAQKPVSRIVRALGDGDFAKGLGNVLKDSHWAGVIGETLEEEYGIILNSLLTGDNEISDLWDLDQQIDIMLGVGLFGGIMSGARMAAYPAEYVNRKNHLSDVIDACREWKGPEWDQIQERIDNADNDGLKYIAGSAAQAVKNGDESQRNILLYIDALQRMRGITIGRDLIPGDEDTKTMQEFYLHGWDGVDKEAIKTAYDHKRGQLQQIDPSILTIADNDGLYATDENGKQIFQGQMREMVRDYLNAKAAYNGMQDGISDRAERRAKAADLMVRSNDNNGRQIEATLRNGDKVHIISGEVGMNDGGVDREHSSASIVIRYEDGRKDMVSPSMVQSIDNVQNTEEVALLASQRAEEEARAEEESALAEPDPIVNLQNIADMELAENAGKAGADYVQDYVVTLPDGTTGIIDKTADMTEDGKLEVIWDNAQGRPAVEHISIEDLYDLEHPAVSASEIAQEDNVQNTEGETRLSAEEQAYEDWTAKHGDNAVNKLNQTKAYAEGKLAEQQKKLAEVEQQLADLPDIEDEAIIRQQNELTQQRDALQADIDKYNGVLAQMNAIQSVYDTRTSTAEQPTTEEEKTAPVAEEQPQITDDGTGVRPELTPAEKRRMNVLLNRWKKRGVLNDREQQELDELLRASGQATRDDMSARVDALVNGEYNNIVTDEVRQNAKDRVNVLNTLSKQRGLTEEERNEYLQMTDLAYDAKTTSSRLDAIERRMQVLTAMIGAMKAKGQTKGLTALESYQLYLLQREMLKTEQMLVTDADIEDAKKLMDEYQKMTGVKMRLITDINEASEEDIQKAIKGGRSWITGDREVVFVLPMIKHTGVDLGRMYRHEVLSHYNLKNSMGEEEWNNFLDQVWDAMPEDQREKLDKTYSRYYKAGKSEEEYHRLLADEFIATNAENLFTKASEYRTIGQKIIDFVTGWIRGNKKGTPMDKPILPEFIQDRLRKVYGKKIERRGSGDETRNSIAYHGSGANFDRFDHSFMSTGEGSQAYGWGTYVSTNEETGRSYADIGSQTKVSYNGPKPQTNYARNLIDGMVAEMRDGRSFDDVKEDILADLNATEERIQSGRISNRSVADEIEFFSNLKASDFDVAQRDGSYLYTVEIPDDNGENYLHWDGMLTQGQSDKIVNALLANPDVYDSFGEEAEREVKSSLGYGTYGKNVNGALNYFLGNGMNYATGVDEGAERNSKFLNSLGIVGMQVAVDRNGGKRFEGDNYVIYNPDDIQIKDKTRFSVSGASVEDEKTEDVFNRAIENYGTTDYSQEAGYMMPDGQYLDFSEGSGARITDHRNVGVAYEGTADEGYKYMYDFMRRGAIRMQPESGGFELAVAPTLEQRRRLREYIAENDGNVILDILNPEGGNPISAEYYEASPARVMGAIDRYFNDGIIPQSDTRYSTTLPDEDQVRYSVREKAAPKKTVKVYKLMRLQDGKVYPLYIDAATPIEMGTWYDADSPALDMLKDKEAGIWMVNPQTGEAISYDEFYQQHPDLFNGKQTKMPSVEAINWATSNGYRFMSIKDTDKKQNRYGENRQYYNLGINGAGEVGEFALRPGWHAGSLPTMRQIGKGKNRNLRDDSFVWVEGEISTDKDYNAEAQQNPDKDIPGRIPEDGYYLKATNADKVKSQADQMGWYVAGSFKPNRILSDTEANQIIDQWNAEHPDAKVKYDYRRESGKVFNAETMSLEETRYHSPAEIANNEGITLETATELVQNDQTMQGGVVMNDDAARLMDETGYMTPNELDTRYSSVTWDMSGRMAYMNRPGARKEVVAALDNMADMMKADELVNEFVPKGIHRSTASGDYGPLRTNVEYMFTFDLDTTCPRTFQALYYVRQIEKRLGRFMTQNEMVQLNELMRAYGQQIPCVYCYAENKRQAKKQYMLDYIVARRLVKNAGNDEAARKVMYGQSKAKGSVDGLTPAADKVLKEWRADRNGYNPDIRELTRDYQTSRNAILAGMDAMKDQLGYDERKTAKTVARDFCAANNITDSKAISAIETIAAEWLWDVREEREHQNFNANNAQMNIDALRVWKEMTDYGNSASGAKSVLTYVPYTDELAQLTKQQKKNINSMGGLRMHSSNDFRIDYVFDYLQLMADMEQAKMMGHTYTKSPAFVEIFGNTGYRINMSIAAYQDENGNIIENHDEGFDWQQAQTLRQIFKNAGTMFMATSNEQLQWGLDTDWVDMIIPFHHSGLDKKYWYNLRRWTDYTSTQTERFYTAADMKAVLKDNGIEVPKDANAGEVTEIFLNSGVVKVVYDKNGKRIKPHFLPGESIKDGKKIPGWHKQGNTPAEDVENYKKLCAEYGVYPRFQGIEVKDSEGQTIDVTMHPGYIKLIKETSRMDSEQTPIQFNLDQPYSEEAGNLNPALKGKTPIQYAMELLKAQAQVGYENDPRYEHNDQWGVVDTFMKVYADQNRPINYLPREAREVWRIMNEAVREKYGAWMEDDDATPYHPATTSGKVDNDDEEDEYYDYMKFVRPNTSSEKGSSNEQTRLSVTPEMDAEYAQAYKEGDTEKAMQMLKAAFIAKYPNTKVILANGEPQVVYHGTPSPAFTAFAKPGVNLQGLVWLSQEEEYAGTYAMDFNEDEYKDYSEPYAPQDRGVYQLFANIVNPLNIGYIEDAVGSDTWNELASKFGMTPEELFDRIGWDGSKYENSIKQADPIYELTRGAKFVSLLKEKGYDGVEAWEGDDQVATFGAVNSNQVKSAEPFVLDDNGKLIPLSERFTESDDIRYSIIGEVGASRDHTKEGLTRLENLNVAREMEEQLKPDWNAKEDENALKIKMATGWERGGDGKWRYEIPDAQFKNGALDKRWGGKTTLGDIVDAPELFAMYPSLKDIKVKRETKRGLDGRYVQGENTMYISTGDYNAYQKRIQMAEEAGYSNYDYLKRNAERALNQIYSTLTHELQHTIQAQEGFARGGSSSMLRPDYDPTELNRKTEEFNRQVDQWNNMSREERRNAHDFSRAIDRLGREIQRERAANVLGLQGYRRLAGETEARNASTRREMTAEQKRNSLLASTEDVARPDQIYIYRAVDNIPAESERFSIANENQRIFVSNAARAVEKIQQEKATPEQWLAMLQKNGGIKAGEDKWLGLSQWLKEQDGKISKNEILEFIDQNGIKIEEYHYSENVDREKVIQDDIRERIGQGKSLEELQEEVDANAESADRYDRLGENPDAAELDEYLMECMIDEYGDDFAIGYMIEDGELEYNVPESWDYEDADFNKEVAGTDNRIIDATRLRYTSDGLDNKREIALTVPTIEPWAADDNIHFGDAGEGRAIAWIRFGDARTEGDRVLVIDEIQSNRHQQGREKGYIATNEDKEGVPDAPFDKNWQELAMKRMLRLAAEEGYDKVAWTTGEQQADRYKLAKIIPSITRKDTKKSSDKGIRVFEMNINDEPEKIFVNGDGTIVNSTLFYDSISDKPLSDFVGKDIAVRMMSMNDGETIDTSREKVGGDGMKTFYDQMLVNFMNKYGKQWGVKVEDLNLPDVENGNYTFHSINVTDQMKKDVMEGQTMFSIAPEQDAEYRKAYEEGDTEKAAQMVKDAFKAMYPDTKVVDENGEPLTMYHGTTTAGFNVFKPREGSDTMGWFTTSKRDADSYAGNAEGKLYDSREKASNEILTAGSFPLGKHFVFDSQEDLDDFVKRFPNASDYMTEREIDDALFNVESDEEEARLESLRDEFDAMDRAYSRYEREHMVDTTIGELLDNPDAYSAEDFERAIYAYDHNAILDEVEEMEPEDEKRELINTFRQIAEENEDDGDIRNIRFKSRVPRGGSAVKADDTNRRTYATYLNITNPLSIDAKGKHSELESGDIYNGIWMGLDDNRYDGIIIKNWRVGRYQNLGTVAIPKSASQIKLANTFTFDDNGELIPLSERFNDENNDIRYSFVGEQAASNLKAYSHEWIMMNDLNNAKAMERQGRSAEWIKSITGWEKGVDGKWRYEMEDLELADDFFEAQTIGDAVKESRLLTAYPELKDAKVLFKYENPVSGSSFNSRDKAFYIEYDTPATAARALVHELQHYIQEEEGFAEGSAPELFDEENDLKFLNEVWSIDNDATLDNLLKNIDNSKEDSPKRRAYNSVYILAASGYPVKDAKAKLISDMSNDPNSFFGKYKRTAGEVEARNVQRRMNLSLADRLASLASATEDVAREDQIIVRNGAVQQFIEDNEPIMNPLNDLTDTRYSISIEPSRIRSEYNDGDIIVYNPRDIADVQAAVMRETYTHKDIRNLNGWEEFMDAAYRMGGNDIVSRAMRNGFDFDAATEQWAYENAERMTAPFEKMMSRNNIDLRYSVTGDEIRMYLTRRNDLLDDAEVMIMKEELPTESSVRFSTTGSPSARDLYDASQQSKMNALYRAYIDYSKPLRDIQDIIAKESGTPIEDFENAWEAENQRSSKSKGEIEKYEITYFEPMRDAVKALQEKAGITYEEVLRYLIAKHGLERNVVLAQRGAQEEYKKYQQENPNGTKTLNDFFLEKRGRDYSGLTSLSGKDDVLEAELYAQDLVDAIESNAKDETDALWEAIDNAVKATQKKRYNSGLISKSQMEHEQNMFQHYIPLRGFAETIAEDVYDYYENTTRNRPQRDKKAKGRTSLADDPLATIGAMAASAITQGNKNLVKQRFLNMVENHPTDLATVKEVWVVNTGTPTDPEWSPEYPDIHDGMTADEITQELEDYANRMAALENMGMAKKATNKLDIKWRTLGQQAQQHIITVRRGGKEQMIIINGNPQVARTVNGINNPDATLDKGLRGVRAVMRFMAANFTTRNPAFVVSNLLRDYGFATLAVRAKESPEYQRKFMDNLTGKVRVRGIGAGVFYKPAQLGKLINKWKGNTLDDSIPVERYFGEFMNFGGETGYTAENTVDAYRKKMQKGLKDKKGIVKGAEAILDFFELMNRSVEDYTRFMTYMTSREMGRSVQRSVADAKNITVNFNRKGSGEMGQQYIASAYLFFNAGMQSLQNVAKISGVDFSLDADGKKIKVNINGGKMAKSVSILFGSQVMLGMLIPMLNEFMMGLIGGDDDDEPTTDENGIVIETNPYRRLTEFERRNNVCLWIGGDNFIKIPIAIELRAFYGLGETIYGYMAGIPNPNPGKDVVAQMTDLLPVNFVERGGLVPDAFAPFVESFVTKENYQGIPLYNDSEYLKYKPESEKVYSGTGETYIAISRFINRLAGGDEVHKSDIDGAWNNPAVMQHLVEGYFGGVLTTFRQTAGLIGKPIKQFATGEEVDPIPAREWPVVNRLYINTDKRNDSRYVKDRYYHYRDKAEQIRHDVREYEKRLDEPKYLKKYQELITSPEYLDYITFDALNKAVKEMHKLVKEYGSEYKQFEVDAMRNLVNALDEDSEGVISPEEWGKNLRGNKNIGE